MRFQLPLESGGTELFAPLIAPIIASCLHGLQSLVRRQWKSAKQIRDFGKRIGSEVWIQRSLPLGSSCSEAA